MATETSSAAEFVPASRSLATLRRAADGCRGLPRFGHLRSGVPGVRTGTRRERLRMGILDKITGRAKKAAGDLTDDASLRRQGKREERKGERKEELDRAQEKADEKAEEVADLERKT